tara:strand:+ start:3099 stop:3272 length:174 start_codon:yes stop_codon:yes gene_type:complete
MNGSVMAIKCPDCDATFFLFGDFVNGEGQFVRAGERDSRECEKCHAVCTEVGFYEHD